MGLTAIANIAVVLSNIILLPILTKTLPIEAYGSWSLVMVTTNLVPSFTTLGLTISLVRFLSGSTNKKHIQEGFYSMAFLILLTITIAAGLFFVFARQIAASLFGGDLTAALLLAPNIFLACFIYWLPNYFRAFHQIKKFAILIVSQAYLNTALIGYFVLSGQGLKGALIGLLVQQLFELVVIAYVVTREIGVIIPTFS